MTDWNAWFNEYPVGFRSIPVEHMTEAMCLKAVQRYPANIDLVPEALLTDEICLAGVTKDCRLLKFVPDKYHPSHPMLVAYSDKSKYPNATQFKALMDSWVNDRRIDKEDTRHCIQNAPARVKKPRHGVIGLFYLCSKTIDS